MILEDPSFFATARPGRPHTCGDDRREYPGAVARQRENGASVNTLRTAQLKSG
jgi:hypothetical protein